MGASADQITRPDRPINPKAQRCREALRGLTAGHCSYCDCGGVEANTNEPIDHFRPKGDVRFEHLAFDWANLYYTCPACQTLKLDRFDEGLLGPDHPAYAFEYWFVFRPATGNLDANPRRTPDEQERARTTIRLFGLNEKGRPALRKREVRRYEACAPSLRGPVDEWSYRFLLAEP